MMKKILDLMKYKYTMFLIRELAILVEGDIIEKDGFILS